MGQADDALYLSGNKKQLTALEARKWMVENPGKRIKSRLSSHCYYWSAELYAFCSVHEDGTFPQDCNTPLNGTYEIYTVPEPQRPTHLTLDNVDEWLPRAYAIIVNKQGFNGDQWQQDYLGSWAIESYVQIKSALREGCTVEVTKWQGEQ